MGRDLEGDKSDTANGPAIPRLYGTRFAKDTAYAGTYLARTIGIVLAPLMVGVLAALLLSVPDQTREIYRIFARDFAMHPLPTEQGWPDYLRYLMGRLRPAPIDLSWIGVAIAGVLNWLLARNLTLEFANDGLAENTVRGQLLRWMPRFCGAVIPFGAAVGLLLAAMDVGRTPIGTVAGAGEAIERETARNLYAVAAFFFAISLAIPLYAWWRTHGARYKYKQASLALFCAPMVLTIIVLTLALVVLFATPLTGTIGIDAARAIGATALFCVFIMLLAYFATGMSVATFRSGIPVVPLLGLGVFAIALFDVNDNHDVPTKASAVVFDRPATREAFRKWYQGRADRQYYERARKPYPVFLVTAAGGGLYAADFAATGLARLQDQCAAFAQHVFAISGVSGGGLGAALFTTLVGDLPQVTAAEIGTRDPCWARSGTTDAGSIEKRVRTLLSQDYFAPVTAAGLFPDFFQRFLPIPVDELDRSRAFEATLDHAWDCSSGGHRPEGCQPFRRVLPVALGETVPRPLAKPFSRMFLDLWHPDATAPALVLNATNVDVGYRTVLSPFVIAKGWPGEYTALEDFHETLSTPTPFKSGVDVTLGTAIGLSSRFPWIMPTAVVQSAVGKPSLRLLDGGIFENSGVDTLTDILNDLRELEIEPKSRTAARDEPWVSFHPIVISGFQLGDRGPGKGFRGEAFSPVSAMLSARVQRAGMASYRLFLDRGYRCAKGDQSPKCSENGLRFLVLNHVDYHLPLGWQLSELTREVVKLHLGEASRCVPIERIRSMFASDLGEKRRAYTIAENNCTACAVKYAIRGEPFMESSLCRTPG